MAMNWTPEQEAAICAHGASVSVSAAAGSGKTAVLVERLVRLLKEEQAEKKVPAETLAVMTFTNDAAAEMRDRLTRALDKAMLEHPESTWLRRQQTMLQCASISTIHSFCYRLMREHFAELDIAADFRTLDENEDRILRAQAASAVLEEYHTRAQSEPEIKQALELLTDAFCTGNDYELEGILLTLLDFTERKPFGEQLLTEAAKSCEDGTMLALAFQEIERSLGEAYSLLKKSQEIVKEHGKTNQLQAISDEVTELEKRVQACADRDCARLSALLQEQFWNPKLYFRNKGHEVPLRQGKALRSHAKEIYGIFWKEKGVQKTNGIIRDWTVPLALAETDLERHAKLLRAAGDMVSALREELLRRKRERNAVSFADAMQMTLRLLAIPERGESGELIIRRTALAEQLSAQFSCIMVDEFQDADDHQDLIFRLLSRGGDAGHYGSNLFFVGDAKQCIYRFRNANPANFSKAMASSAPYQGEPALTENTLINLNMNFRSAAEIIEAVNCIFSQLMTEQVGEIRYDETQALVQGAKYPEGNRPVELLFGYEDEPAAVAERIRQNIDMQTVITDKETKQERPCEARDFLILLRTKTHMQDYAEALAARGIAAAAPEMSDYLGSQEIRLLLSMLRAVDNPLLDTAMAATMLSPMFGFTLDDLALLRITDRKRRLFPAMEHLRRLWKKAHGEKAEKEPDELPEAEPTDGEQPDGKKPEETFPEDFDQKLFSRICNLLDFLSEMRLFAATETPEQLIRRLLAATDFLGLIRLDADAVLRGSGAQKKANLRAMIQYAKNYEENSGGGLSGFLRYLDALIARGADLAAGSVPNGTDNAVVLKTIHKSKGLEKPFVILARSDGSFSAEDEKKVCQFHAQVGIGFKLLDPDRFAKGSSLPAQTVITRARREALSEELRLLYVALTRAREHLILPLKFAKKSLEDAAEFAAEQEYAGGQTDLLTARAGCMRDWIVMALLRNTACEALRRKLEVECETDGSQPVLTVAFPPPAGEQEDTEETAAAAPDDALTARLTEHCQKTYDTTLAKLTAKYGVSELAKAEDFSVPLLPPRFDSEKSGLTGAERGTAVHTFLQYADFARASAHFEEEIAELQRRGRLTEQQANAVRDSKVQSFFASDLCRRAIAAGSRTERERKFTVCLSDLELPPQLQQIAADYAGTEGMLIGIMDLVFEEPDGYVLVDYKTDGVKKPEDLLALYTEQLLLYKAALTLLTGKPVKEWYLFSIKHGAAVRGG